MKLVLILAILFTSLTANAAGYSEQFTTNYESDVSVSTSAQVLAQNMKRGYLMIQNKGSQTVYVKLGSTIATSEGAWILAGGSYEFFIVPTDSIWMKSATGTQTVHVIEGTAL